MKNILFTTFLAISLFSVSTIFAQDGQMDNQQLLEILQGEQNQGASVSSDQGYKSFVQNELSGVYKQLAESETDEMENVRRVNLNKERIKLAVKLCAKDSRACFLIDTYRNYQNFIPKITSEDELKLFGQEIFSGYSNEFNFYDSLPISKDYIIQMGDIVHIYLYGGLDSNQEYIVNNEGSILIEGLGSIVMAGLSFSEATRQVKELLDNQYLGTEAIVSLKEIRSKQIFLLGKN